MPYIHVIEGKSASIGSREPYKMRDSVTSLKASNQLQKLNGLLIRHLNIDINNSVVWQGHSRSFKRV